MELAAFYILSVLAVASALVVLTHRNEVICALGLAFNLVAISGFYFLLGAQFIGFLQLIVYAGAIMVLILFVVMLLNLGEENYPPTTGLVQRWAAPVLTAVFAVVLGRFLWASEPRVREAAEAGYGSIGELGRELFGRFFYPFELISLLLVVAMVGAVLLAKRRI